MHSLDYDLKKQKVWFEIQIRNYLGCNAKNGLFPMGSEVTTKDFFKFIILI